MAGKGFGQVAKPKQIQSWSFTRFSDYDQCPAFAKYKHLDKYPQGPKNPAMQRGADIAQATEDWFKGHRRAMPVELKPLGEEYKRLKKDKSTVAEQDWGFTSDWEPCSTTDWNRCWLRVKIDLHRIAEKGAVLKIDDSKTGKFSEYKVAQYEQQLSLYAAVGTIMVPTAKSVETRLLFSDLGYIHPRTGPKTYTKAQAEAEIKAWEKRIKPMLNDTRFPPKPGRYCSWCPFSKNAVFKEYDDAGNVTKEIHSPGPCKF